ncbi:SSV1 integrase fragment-like protein (orf D-335) [Thermococcus gammatolerans EJ3]|uniref:SSV1 integrase-like protein (Orf D-335) n=2 Tax=Thermococcus TaxID=2263 RepID=C5A7A7_THEGJ|nr:SSV1 integrase fragment-like protein (orf D-335) [Thermococcus gammatolerans EJ3]
MNPRPSAPEAPFDDCEPLKRLLWEKERLLSKWAIWAEKQLTKRVARAYLNALKKAQTFNDLLQMREGSKTQRLALRSFAKYLYESRIITKEEYEAIKRCVKLKRTNNIDTRVYSDEDITNILRQLTNKKHHIFLRLVVESGLRRSHAISAWGKLRKGEYTTMGEFAYTELNIRNKTKQAFVCFCSRELADAIHEMNEPISYNIAENVGKRQRILYNGIRKWWYTTALDVGMDSNVADFLQGRAPTSIGARHYLDALRLAKKQYPKLLQAIRERIYSNL